MKKKMAIFLGIFASVFFFFSNQGHTTEPLPPEFEAIYEDILKNPTYASLGNPKGTYVIIDFFDYRCQFCQKLHKTLSELVNSKEGRNIRWISIEAPVFGYKYNYASDIILGSRKHGKYQKLFAEAAKTGTLAQSDIYGMFKKMGGDEKQLRTEVENTSFRPIYKEHFKLYHHFKSTAVPIVILNKKYQIGGLKEGQLEQIIKEAKPPFDFKTIFLKFF